MCDQMGESGEMMMGGEAPMSMGGHKVTLVFRYLQTYMLTPSWATC